MSTTINITVALSPTDMRTLDKLKSKLDNNTSEVVAKALRLLAFNIGVKNVIETLPPPNKKKSND